MDDEEYEFDLAYRWSWWRPATVVCGFASEVLEAASRAATHLTLICAAVNNYQIEQEDFRRAVALDIESLGSPEN